MMRRSYYNATIAHENNISCVHEMHVHVILYTRYLDVLLVIFIGRE